jgi:hypothetical protein
LFEATLAGVELAGQLANRSFDELRAVQGQYGNRIVEQGGRGEVFGREEAINYLKSWLDDNARESLIICDPTFGPEDLILMQMTRAVNPKCHVEVLTCKPQVVPPEGLTWQDVYLSQWSDLSEQSPPPTRITMLSPLAAVECPIRSSWMISENTGVELGGSIKLLGNEGSFRFRTMDDEARESLRQDVQSLLAGAGEWAGTKIRFTSFSL